MKPVPMTLKQFRALKRGDYVRVSQIVCLEGYPSPGPELRDVTLEVESLVEYEAYGGYHEVKVTLNAKPVRAKIEEYLIRHAPSFLPKAPIEFIDHHWRHSTAAGISFYRAARRDDPHYPHECPQCGGPAYLGAVPAAFDCGWNCNKL